MLAASKTLGQIAAIGGADFGEGFMDLEVPAAVELLQGAEPPRYAGVLILKELARNSANYFHSHISLVFDKILIPLRDSRVMVREGAAELLAACLEIVANRERTTRTTYLMKILQDAQLGLKMAQPEVIHGSLLMYRELLLHGDTVSDLPSFLREDGLVITGVQFMRESFLDTAEQILRFKSHRDSLVRKMVITLIPTLAAYDTQTFSEHHLHKSMSHLLTQLEKPNERSFGAPSLRSGLARFTHWMTAFIAIGHTATAVSSDMKPFLDSIMVQIKLGLQQRGYVFPADCIVAPHAWRRKKNAPSEEPIFQCVGMLASAVGPNLTKLLHDQLDLFFACGLSEPLRQALVAIARNIPPLLKTIQDRLLDLLSMILIGQSYRVIGAPPALVRSDVTAHPRDLSGTKTGKSPELITLALSTLGSFDFSGKTSGRGTLNRAESGIGHVLNEFVRSAALPYLEDDNADVRRAGALTCCKVFMRDPICYQASSHAIEIISDVLDKLLTVGIADPGEHSILEQAVFPNIIVQIQLFDRPFSPPCTNASTNTSPKQKTSVLSSFPSMTRSLRIVSPPLA